jgi:polygalacturonase
VIRDNLLSRIPADGIQMGGIRNALIEGNHFKYISAFVDPAEHSDGIQILGRNDHVVIRRNLFDHVRGIIALAYSGRVAPGHPRGLTIEDNVLVQLHHFAMVLLDTDGLRLTHNTVWEGATGVALRNGTGNAIVAHNVLNRFEASPDMLSLEDHNLIASGYRKGPHDTARRPRFVAPRKLDYRLKPGSPGAGKRGPSLGARGLAPPR